MGLLLALGSGPQGSSRRVPRSAWPRGKGAPGWAVWAGLTINTEVPLFLAEQRVAPPLEGGHCTQGLVPAVMGILMSLKLPEGCS